MEHLSGTDVGIRHLLARPAAATFELRCAVTRLDRDAFTAAVLHLAEVLRVRPAFETRGTAIVLAPRSQCSTIVALFALWESGLTPLLLDHLAPDTRLDAAVKALDPTVVLRWDPHGPETGTDVLGQRWHLDRRTGSDRLEGCPDPAYVAMTSGSTGVPLMPLCRWSGVRLVAQSWSDVAHLGPESRVLQFASPTYDAFYTEVLPAVLAGSTLVCLGDDTWASPSRLIDRIIDERITHLTVPPSFANRLFATGRMPVLPFLGLAGEALDPATAAQALTCSTRLVNAYGPAEATVCVSSHLVEDIKDEVPLGAPWPHVNLVIDEGEIVIGGPAVGWTYLGGPPEVTRFEGDPASGVRRFRTGDLGELRDGVLYFRGRKDDQLKVFGHRIDLRSIEWRVRQLPGVLDCAVVVWRGRPACLVKTDRDVSGLARDLRAQLVAAELPARWMSVEEIPYLASDKINGRAVAALLEAEGTSTPNEIDPSWLAEIWRQFAVLGAPDDDFFSSGGDSLMAMELLDAVYDCVGVDVEIGDFLTSPTFAWLRAELAEAQVR